MKFFIAIVVCFFPLLLPAQDCTKELLAQKAGAWKAAPQGFIQNVSKIDLAKEKKLIAEIHKMVSTNYKPVGCVINYSTVYGKHVVAGDKWIADPYQYNMYLLKYLCDPVATDRSKFYVDTETPTVVNITANALYSLNTLYAGEMFDDTRGYLKLKQRPLKKDGYYFLGEEIVGNSQAANKIKEYRWLITYNDTLPFVYVTRKEYLWIQKKRLEQNIKDSPGEKTYLENFMNNINEHLKLPDDELSQPAVCMWNEEQRFEKFVDEGTPGSFIAVKPNLTYYHKKVPMSSPQFFTVVYKIAHLDPVFEKNISDIQKAVDFALLKNMLGK